MSEGAAGNTTKARREPRRVLIVDDEEAIRKLLRRLIEELPVPSQIFEAADGDTAIDLARRSRPDLALVDIMLPDSGASGVLVCWEFCRDSRTKVVIVSGQATESVVQAALSAGAIEYVRKPFSVDEMRQKLAGWLAD